MAGSDVGKISRRTADFKRGERLERLIFEKAKGGWSGLNRHGILMHPPLVPCPVGLPEHALQNFPGASFGK